MVKELNRDCEPNWDEKIEISLSLRDLQLIYDCIGGVPLNYLNHKHKTSKFLNKYDATYFTRLYNELDEILNFHNGIVDEDTTINYAELIMTDGDENE